MKASGMGAVVAFAGGAHSAGPLTIGDCLTVPASEAFSFGVACGDVTGESAILSTCFTSGRALKLGLWEAQADLGAKPLIWADVYTLDGGFVHIDAIGLKSYTNYTYAFFEPLGRSRVGYFRTAPDSNMLVPLTIGASCCTDNMYQPVVLEHAAMRNDLDVFLLLGDSSYNDGCKTLKEFRAKWAQSFRKKGYMDLRASTSVIAALDDHEVIDNFDPETTPKSVLSSALRAFHDFTPTRSRGNNQLWRTFRWGRTCEIFVMDCRTERRPSTRGTRLEQYISREQMEWLKNGLRSSNASFKLIMNSVPIGIFPFPSASDRWEGYPSQRNEILSFIDDQDIKGVLWLSGDFHFASVGRVSPHGPGSNQTEILAGPGAQVPNPLGLALNASKHFDWASIRNNYVTLTFSPEKYEVKLCYMGGDADPQKTRLGSIEEIYSQTLLFNSDLMRA